MIARGVAIVAVVLALGAVAAAQPATSPARRPAAIESSNPLVAAAAALLEGDHDEVERLAGPVATSEASGPDRAEAHRLLGLAHFFRHRYEAAEAAFLAYLELDLDGGLDPSQYPPEVISFFEDVRSRNAAALRVLRPRQRRWRLLNLLPPGGQIQNRSRTKAWVIGGAELVLAATHVTSYLVLRSWCRRDDFTCVSGDADVPEAARRLRVVNYLSGAALIGVYLYGVVDGFRGYAASSSERRRTIVSATPVAGGVVVGASLSF